MERGLEISWRLIVETYRWRKTLHHGHKQSKINLKCRKLLVNMGRGALSGKSLPPMNNERSLNLIEKINCTHKVG